MPYPASVEQVTSSRLRQNKSKSRRRPLIGDGIADDDDVDVGVGLGGPVLDFGREGGVKLETEKGGWKWTWLNQKGNRDLLTCAEGVLLYPACRLADADLEDVPASKVADSAVDYVRSLPDISEYASISDLIVDELAAVDTPMTSSSRIYRGNTLSVIVNAKAKSARALLAFPAGPIGCQLNISPFLPTSDAKRHRPYLTTFRPSSQPAERFPTEILQICSSPYLSGSKIDREMTAFLVRIQLTTYMLNVSPHRITCLDEDSVADTTRVAELSYTDTEGRRHVDVVLDQTSWSKALVVDEGGGIWLWWEEKVEIRERLAKTMKLRKIRSAINQDRHGFFRIAFGSRPGTAVVMSSRQLSVVEYEEPSETVIMTLSGSGREFTSLETTSLSRNATYTCVATNHEVLWIDELSPGPPVLTWRHDLDSGAIRDLRLQVINGPTSEYSLLSSPDSPLIMVFDVPSSPPTHSRGTPRCLALPRSSGQAPLISLSGLDLGGKGRISGVDSHLAALDAVGALHSFDMGDWTENASGGMDIEGDQVMGKQHPEPVWSQAIKNMANLDEVVMSGKPWADKAKTKHKVFDLRDIWLELNGDETEQETSFGYETLDQHLRERDAPLDSFVTLGDLARDAISEQDAGRTHALLPLDIGADVFAEDLASLGTIDIAKHELHQAVILPLEHLTGDAETTKDPMADLYATFSGIPAVPLADGQTRYQRDIQRLVLDLTLSRMILHSEELETSSSSIRASQEPPTADDLFERAGQLTLNDDNESRISPHTFKWLAPRNDYDQDPGEKDVRPSQADLISSAARALLGDWKVGTDPTQFIWKDWRGETSAVPQPIRRPVRPLPSPRATATQTFAQSQIDSRYRPPSIAQPQPRPQWALHTSNSIPNILAHGQTTRSSPPPVLHSSQSYQDLGVNTQAERGPFGGRLDSKARKKPAKKRVGGF